MTSRDANSDDRAAASGSGPGHRDDPRDTLVTRPVTASDIDVICRHRAAMFHEAGRDEAALDRMAGPFRRWLEARLADGSYFGFIVDDDDRPIAGIGLMVIEWPPHPLHPGDDRRGYVLNLYVDPAYRRRGLAHGLMRAAEAAFAAKGVHYMVLHATKMARALYGGLGWADTAEMAKPVERSI